ncbi:MAG: histidine kinase [Acidobacteria bacterium]|nr:histidine kinase [Acidobacteriota bacterium]
MRSPRAAAAFAIFLASTVAGLYFATQLMIAYPPPIRRPLGEALQINLTYYYLWGLSVPLVVWVARRFRFERGTWVFSLVIHSFWAILLTLAQIVIAENLLRHFGHARDDMQAKPIAQAVLDNFQSSLPTYFVILFCYYAFDYYVKFRDRELRASQLETRLSQAQLQALKMQLNPHFLFNTLNTISSLMYTDIEAADAMMSRLSELLRLTLEKEAAAEVTLKEEMDLLERYLDIERIRFEDRLRVSVDIAPEALEARVPNFSLQPLVENAIRHGIAPRPEGGRLEITAQREDGQLEIRLRDDGPGLRPMLAGVPRREGIGVANTRARLAQLYGERYRFELANAPGGGTMVTMIVPFHT